MKVNFFLALTIFGSVVVAADYYADLYDNTNVGAILQSERLFKAYLACLLDSGPCTADARAFRTIFPEAIATNCAKCNFKQRSIARQIGRHLRGRPNDWAQVIQKYDPSHVYEPTFLQFLDVNE